jgi:DNA gyrase subunit A
MEIEELIKIIPAPDFPTAGIIYGYEGVRNAYLTGKGKIIVRAKANIEKLKSEKENIVIVEIPFQVNKSTLLEKMAELVKDKKIEGIYDIRDESDRDGLRIVVELKRDVQADVILNQFYKHTQMQVTFGVIMLALVKGAPRILNLKDLLLYFIEHYHNVVFKRTKFDLEDAEKKAHILEGLKIALDNIDEIVALIKASKNPQVAKDELMKRFKLSEIQAKAILDMRLQRLTGLEREKIESEYLEMIKLISRLRAILESRPMRMEIIKEGLKELDKKYGDERRTEIIKDFAEFSLEDIIAEEDMVITISHSGFIKRFPVSGYRKQLRGGRGSMGAVIKEEDFVEHLFVASTHHYILFFTDKGRCYGLKVHELPVGGKAIKGRAIVNLIEKEKDENVAAFVSVKEFDDGHFIIMSTEKGTIKKTPLSSFKSLRKKGVNAITIREGDRLIETKITDGTQDVILGTYCGQALRFMESNVRSMGKTASGVRGIRLSEKDRVVGMITAKIGGSILTVTEKGYGKRSDLKDYRLTKRGGKGIKTIKTTEKTGMMIAILDVIDNDDLMIITENGVVIRQHLNDIRVMGRNTQGVKLIKLDKNDFIADIAKVVREEDDKSLPEDNGIKEDKDYSENNDANYEE